MKSHRWLRFVDLFLVFFLISMGKAAWSTASNLQSHCRALRSTLTRLISSPSLRKSSSFVLNSLTSRSDTCSAPEVWTKQTLGSYFQLSTTLGKLLNVSIKLINQSRNFWPTPSQPWVSPGLLIVPPSFGIVRVHSRNVWVTVEWITPIQCCWKIHTSMFPGWISCSKLCLLNFMSRLGV